MKTANENQSKEMFEHNLKLLSPWLRDSIARLDDTELWSKVRISFNDDGYPICQYQESDSCFHINSINPIKEAELWCKQFSVTGAGAIFMYGSGFGYPLFEIFRRKQPHTLVVLFEENLFLFSAMLHYFDLEPIIRTQKIVFLIGNTKYFAGAFDQLFFNIVFAGCTSPLVVFTNTARRNFKAQYLEIHKFIFSQLGLYVFYLGNDHLDNLIGMNNLLLNIKEIVVNPYLSCLKNSYKDVPAFIIANGPSLDKNIHELVNINGKGLIISTESAIVPLMKNNIKPDILTIIERTKYTYKYHFEGIKHADDLALLALGLIDRNVYPSFQGAKIPIFRNQESINQWINKYLGDGSALDAGANVSHLAFELAVYLGANPIVFVGQDYAYSTDGMTHSKDSVYFEEKGKKTRKIMEKKPVVYVESNTGSMIASNQLWTDFRKGLEAKIASHPDKTILNATEGGAKIKGATCETLSNVISKYCNTQLPCRVNEIIAQSKSSISIQERKESLAKFISNAEEYSILFGTLGGKANTWKLKCKEMLRFVQDNDINEHRKLLEDTYKQCLDTYQSFIHDDLIRCFCQQLIFSYYYLMNRLGITDTQEKITELFSIQYNFFKSLNSVCLSVSVHLENAVLHVRDVLTELETGKELMP